MFVLAIDTNSVNGSQERTIWRFSHDHQPAEDAWFRLDEYARSGRIARVGREQVKILAVRLYETTSADREIARELVQAGEAKALKDSDNSLIGLSGDELRELDEIVASMMAGEDSP